MKILLPASSLNFLAGILAGAGINLITSVATGPDSTVSIPLVAFDTALWVVAAGLLTWAAQIVQRGEREADLEINRNLSEIEKRDIRDMFEQRSWGRARVPVVWTVIVLAGAILLLPRFIPWGGLF
jgi:hypothetical protein